MTWKVWKEKREHKGEERLFQLFFSSSFFFLDFADSFFYHRALDRAFFSPSFFLVTCLVKRVAIFVLFVLLHGGAPKHQTLATLRTLRTWPVGMTHLLQEERRKRVDRQRNRQTDSWYSPSTVSETLGVNLTCRGGVCCQGEAYYFGLFFAVQYTNMVLAFYDHELRTYVVASQMKWTCETMPVISSIIFERAACVLIKLNEAEAIAGLLTLLIS